MAYAIPMLFLLFPTGAPPTPRWRWVDLDVAAGTILSGIWLVFRPGSIYAESDRFSIPNPIGLGFLRPLEPLLFDVGRRDRPRVGGGGVVSLVVRFRRARGEERQQITWLLLVAIVAAVPDADDVRPGPARHRDGLRRPLDLAGDGAGARDPGSHGARDLPLPPLRRRRRRLEDDHVRGFRARDRGRLRRDRGRTRSVDRRRVGPDAPARRGDPRRHRRAAGLVALQPAREPASSTADGQPRTR